MSSSSAWKNRLGCSSAAQYVSTSIAVSRASLRDVTNTITGLCGLNLVIALYTGFDMARFAFALRLEIAYVDGKFVLLIAAQIRIAHVVERVLVVARTRRDKVQLHLCLLLQREPFDGQERVRFRITDNDPPAFLAFLLRGERKRKKGKGVNKICNIIL